MGLGISVVLSKQNLFSFLKSTLDARAVATQFLGVAQRNKYFGRLATLVESEPSRATVLLVPIEEAVEFVQLGQHVLMSAKTSSAGPGYHAYLIDRLEELAALAKLTITETGEHFDEAGYFSSRDFAHLQNEMDAICEAQADLVGKYSDTKFQLSMPVDGAPLGIDALALTSQGPRNLEFFQGDKLAERFFPWWDEGLTGRSALGLAKALLWTEYPWRKSQEPDEEHLEAAIALLLELADGAEVDALEVEFSRARANQNPPEPIGPGYRRCDFDRQIGGNWTIRVPGYFSRSFEDGNSTFWFNDREVHAATFSVSTVDGKLIDPFEEDGLDFLGEENGLIYKARCEPFERDGFGGFKLWGGAYDNSGFVFVTIVFSETSDEEWARMTLRSLAKPAN